MTPISNSYSWKAMLVAGAMGVLLGYLVFGRHSSGRTQPLMPSKVVFEQASNPIPRSEAETIRSEVRKQPPVPVAENRQVEQKPTDKTQALWQFKVAGYSGMADTMTEKERAAYDALFSELGLNTTNSQQLQAKLRDIRLGSMLAEEAMSAVMEQRLNYQGMVDSLMSPDARLRYEELEKTKPAVREFKKIASYFTNQLGRTSATLDSQQLTKLIAETKAITGFTSEGPYDGLPQTAVGPVAVSQHLERKMSELVSNANSLIQRLNESGSGAQELEGIAAYYQGVLEKLQQQKDGADRLVGMSPDQIREDARNRALKAMQDAGRPVVMPRSSTR